MVDIHTHILHGIDDGPDSMKESVQMAQMAYDDGIRHVVATPHHHWARFALPDMKRKVSNLQAAIHDKDIDLTIHTGHEVNIPNLDLDDLESDAICRLAQGKYLLVEPDFFNYDQATDDLLEELFERDFKLVMAHPERILPLIGNFHKIEWFVERGGLVQLTAKSLYPEARPNILTASKELLKNDMAHIIASDMHDASYRPAGLSRARAIAASWIGDDKAWKMVTETPASVIANVF